MQNPAKRSTRLRAVLSALPIAILPLALLLSCEDTITKQVGEAVRVAGLPERTITIAATQGGSVTPNAGAHGVKDGEPLAIGATPGSSYTFITWEKTTGEGQVIFAEASSPATTVSVKGGDATIRPTYTTTPRVLTLNTDGHGTTMPASTVQVGDGQAYSVSASPFPGFVFDHWSTTAASVAAFGNANQAATTVTLSGGDATISAAFVPGSYAVTFAAGPGGAVLPTGAQTLAGGSATTVTATPDADHTFVNWTAIPSLGALSLSSATAAATDVSAFADATLTANFSPKSYTLTMGTSTGGSATPTSTSAVTALTPAGISATFSAGYVFDKWIVTSGSASFGDPASGATTVSVSGGNAAIKPTFKAGSYSVAVAAGTGGTVAPTGAQIMPGGTATNAVSATPGVDYNFASWSVAPPGALGLSPSATASSINVTARAAASLTATFTLKSYTLTMATVVNGNAYIEGQSFPRTVVANAKASIAAYPNAGFGFKNWTASGGTAVFDDPNSSTTKVSISGGNVTISPVYQASSFSFSLDGTYAPGTDGMPSFFADAILQGGRLVVLGSVNADGSSGEMRSIDVSQPSQISTGSVSGNVVYAGEVPTALAANATTVWASSSNYIYSSSLSDVSNPAWTAGSYHDLVWDYASLKLFALTESTREIRSLSAGLALESTASPTFGYSFTNSPMRINRIFDFGGYNGAPLFATGTIYTSPYEENHLATFASAPKIQSAAYATSAEDLTIGWDPMSESAPEIGAVSTNDDNSIVAVAAKRTSGDCYIDFYDNVTLGFIARKYLGGSGSATSLNGIDSSNSWPLGIVAGSQGGKATIWVLDYNQSATPPYLPSPIIRYTYNVPGYATALWVGLGPSGSNVNYGEYYAVVKKTLAGVDKLEVVALGLHY